MSKTQALFFCPWITFWVVYDLTTGNNFTLAALAGWIIGDLISLLRKEEK